jgi:uncharacterized membrane protein
MRWLRHLCMPSAQRWFGRAPLQAITQAIADGERRHRGQLVLAVEADLEWGALWRGETARQRAERAFALLKVWDTPGNDGVLLYLLLADHAIEVVADRGLSGLIAPEQWQQVCDRLRERVRQQMPLAEATQRAVEEMSDLLATALPAIPGDVGRDAGLPDRPYLL